MKLDPTQMKDWQIAEAAEETLRPAADLVAELGLTDDEWDAHGKYLAKVDVTKVLKRVGDVVQAGESIAIVGNMPLWFELWQDGKAINPEEVIAF